MFSKVAQIDRQPNGGEQRRCLREKSYDLAACPNQSDIEGEQHKNERCPARRAAGLPAPRLQPLAAGGKVFDFIGIRCRIRMCRRFD
ncbi:MAG: hypothetical protein WBV76_09175 [Pseudolabrys sp.]|jgi:hypothetical protein